MGYAIEVPIWVLQKKKSIKIIVNVVNPNKIGFLENFFCWGSI